jgi:hypothetical protein
VNYTTLTNQILSYSNRNEPAFVAAIPDLINQAMSRIYSEAKAIGFQKVVNGNMVGGTATILKPQDFKECINFQYTVPGISPFSTFLLERTYEFCITYAPNPLLIGAPIFYSTDLIVPPNNVAPAQFFIAPTPNNNYAYQLTYISFPPIFNVQNPVNFLTDKYPNLLLYACLVEAVPFLKSDERVPVFESLYNRALQSVNNDTQNRYIDRISKRDKD